MPLALVTREQSCVLQELQAKRRDRRMAMKRHGIMGRQTLGVLPLSHGSIVIPAQWGNQILKKIKWGQLKMPDNPLTCRRGLALDLWLQCPRIFSPELGMVWFSIDLSLSISLCRSVFFFLLVSVEMFFFAKVVANLQSTARAPQAPIATQPMVLGCCHFTNLILLTGPSHRNHKDRHKP